MSLLRKLIKNVNPCLPPSLKGECLIISNLHKSPLGDLGVKLLFGVDSGMNKIETSRIIIFIY